MEAINGNMPDVLTLGSLFSGSGGFELAGIMAGIKPVWNCEVEPFPIRVTAKRLPDVKHYGDISTLKGSEIEPVDIITGGFPCQSVSIAGKRAGVKHVDHGAEQTTRSGLFYEAARIIREMREATNGEKPRYFVVENVPGLFSSNKGEDFRAVLEEIIQIVEPAASVPAPDKKGWPYADCYLGDGWSVAYRVLDAQYWGVPQRRQRIFLVADFAGERAPEVLFKSEGVSGYSAEGFRSWQRAAAYSEGCPGEAGGEDENRRGRVVLNDQGGDRMDITEEVTCTLRAEAHHPPVVLEEEPAAAGFCTEHSANARSIGYEEETSPTLRAGVVPAAIALENHPTDSRVKIAENNVVQTLTERMGTGGGNVPLVMDGELTPQTLKIRSGCEGGGKGPQVQDNKSATLGCNNDQTVFVPYGVCSKASHAMMSDNPHSGFYEAQTSRTLDQNGGRPDCSQGGIAIVAFTQNQREEVRDLHDVSSTLAAEPGMKQQTYVAQPAFSLQGNMIGREVKNGPQGSGVNEDVSFTLDATDRHGVAYCMTTGEYTQVEKERTPTLMARDYKDPPVVTEKEPVCMATGQAHAEILDGKSPTLNCNAEAPIITEPFYIVRRLTPTECARLQGFPDWWCQGLGIEEPTAEDIAFWSDVFETHRRIVTKATKPKTEKQIVKWLKNPHSDSAEYKLWGNGVALPVVFFVLSGIKWAYEKDLSQNLS